MEKPLFQYRNYLRNTFVITIWGLLFLVTLRMMLLAFSILEFLPNWNSKFDWVVFVTVPTLTLAIGWYFKILNLKIHIDAIVLREFGPHPNLVNEFGIVFENIYEYKIKSIALTFKWLVLKRTNGKTIRKLISLSKREFIEFSGVLNEKIKNNTI
ncbi:hypothetical protein L3049_00925 [Labilibaculum sp. DW002]|uniref:DUF304 domain-containing protein n=1 Tax=Paralabilibaculum antarcticum TaxID=2912572 RepID=A0ABT5VMR8_9BACT|nr:hypothetical protein [Labilibaculum sp. DW002]MDE5416551.1 hypothetical protein [Labilibaculum sp. DW002]